MNKISKKRKQIYNKNDEFDDFDAENDNKSDYEPEIEDTDD